MPKLLPDPDAPLTRLDRIALNFATLGPLGRSPRMPGTVGSFAAAAVAPWCFLPLGPAGRLGLLAVLFLLGGLAAARAARVLGIKDPGCVIVDELVGQWTAMLPFAALSPWELAAAFLLFRAFDIAKPPPVCTAERCPPSGLGIMLDDLVAGAYAAICLWLFRLVM